MRKKQAKNRKYVCFIKWPNYMKFYLKTIIIQGSAY